MLSGFVDTGGVEVGELDEVEALDLKGVEVVGLVGDVWTTEDVEVNDVAATPMVCRTVMEP